MSLVPHLSSGVAGRQNFHTNFRGNLESVLTLDPRESLCRIPAYVRSLNSVDRRYRTFGQRMIAQVSVQQNRYPSLPIAVAARWRRVHHQLSVCVRLDAERQVGQARVGKNLGPTPPIQFKLLCMRWKLNYELHRDSRFLVESQDRSQVLSAWLNCRCLVNHRTTGHGQSIIRLSVL